MTARLILAAAAVAVAAACTAGETAPSIDVEPRTSYADEPVRFMVEGLEPRSTATVSLRATDALGIRWRSSARFRADGEGAIDLDRATPLSGDYGYTGAYGMGLVWSMTPSRQAFAFAWKQWHQRASQFRPGPHTFTASVSVRGETVATTTFTRRASPQGFEVERLTLREHGFLGWFWSPLGRARRPAILLLGEDRVPDLHAASLASRGYPVLGVVYCCERGLPHDIAGIPLEYFRPALEWLRRRQEGDPRTVIAFGLVRGGEGALLLGVHYPNLVRGVVAVDSSNAARCSDNLCTQGPPWTLHGRPLPYTAEQHDALPTDNPEAVIEVERIQGPVFLACGSRAGRFGCSLGAARAILGRLEARGHRHEHVLHAYQRSSGVAGLVPYFWRGGNPNRIDDELNEKARADLWPRLLEFLEGFDG